MPKALDIFNIINQQINEMNRVMSGQTIIDEQVFIISHLIVIN